LLLVSHNNPPCATQEIVGDGVLDLLDDDTLFQDVMLLNKLLEPISNVIMGAQRDSSRMSDMARNWVYLA